LEPFAWWGRGWLGWLWGVVLRSYPPFCPRSPSEPQEPRGRGRARPALGWDAAGPAFCARHGEKVWALAQFYG